MKLKGGGECIFRAGGGGPVCVDLSPVALSLALVASPTLYHLLF